MSSKGWWEVEESDPPVVEKIKKKGPAKHLAILDAQELVDQKVAAAHTPGLKNVQLCMAKPPAGKGCKDEHVCCLAKGHETPHRSICGNKWQNKQRKP